MTVARPPLPRIDTTDLKRRHPVDAVVGRYVDLRRSGTALLGRCPFHRDGGRPNLHVYAGTGTWICYRCGARGDAIGFVERIEGLDFIGAVRLLERAASLAPPRPAPAPAPAPVPLHDPEREACLGLATAVYAARLPRERAATRYCAARGLDPAALARLRVGYAAGDELAPALRRRGLSPDAAARAGLLVAGRHGDFREFFAGRIVVPEIRAGATVWMTGRAIPARDGAPPRGRRYLNLPGPKRLLGWGLVRGGRAVFVVEGPFDWLTLVSWGLPALALGGTDIATVTRREALAALARFGRVFLALDGDRAGREAAAALGARLGPRAIGLHLPGVEDVAELAPRPDGPAIFRRAIRLATAPASRDERRAA